MTVLAVILTEEVIENASQKRSRRLDDNKYFRHFRPHVVVLVEQIDVISIVEEGTLPT
jgi:hypothetical protein